ncbi:MAG: hypothetical protein ACPGXK_10785 [Phycisphaerae bacterium]
MHIQNLTSVVLAMTLPRLVCGSSPENLADAESHRWRERSQLIECIVVPVPVTVPKPLSHYFTSREAEWRFFLRQSLAESESPEAVSMKDRYHCWEGREDRTWPPGVPSERRLARAYFKEVDRRQAGGLPWAILESQAALSQAMSNGDEVSTLVFTGRLLALAALTGLPSSTVCPSKIGDDEYAGAERIHWQEFQCLGTETYSEDVKPPTCTLPAWVRMHGAFLTHDTSTSVWDQIQDELEQRAALADMILAAPREDGLPAHRCFWWRPLIRDAFASGRALAWGSVVEAWEQAGRPAWLGQPAFEKGASPVVRLGGKHETDGSATPGVVASDDDGWVGSVHSSVVHRMSCTHAKRIRSDNLVRYSSLARAKAEGRSACKACAETKP